MRIMHALIPALALTLGAPALAQEGQPQMTQEQIQQMIAEAMAKQQPTPIPVPDGPVVKRTELEGGLIVEDLTIGDGYEIKPGDFVVANYHGTLKEGGNVFDSSFERGEPIGFPLDGVIVGWQKGVPGMKIGGVRRLTIPAAMGYGERGAGSDIPPNADLVFVISMIDALRYEDITIGEGEEVGPQCVVVTAHVITDNEGNEIEKRDATNPYIWLPGEFQPIQFGLAGMKQGGKRKLIVPAQMNMSPPQLGSTRPQQIPLTIELELISVRNLNFGG